MGQVVGNITHQWKIPLARLGALLTELEASVWSRSEHLEKSVTQTVPKMRETLRFMDETIGEFASFYKSDSVKVVFVIQEQIEEIQHLLMAKSITVDCKVFIEESCKEECFGYKNAFGQVIMILLDNTLDIAKKREIKSPKIVFSLQKKSKGLELSMEDNCGGAKQKPIESIFELFESDQEENQSGMGLAIAKKMIEEKMDGKIRVQNTQKGAKFTLFLRSF
jgi:signal transduction histidine kinase